MSLPLKGIKRERENGRKRLGNRKAEKGKYMFEGGRKKKEE